MRRLFVAVFLVMTLIATMALNACTSNTSSATPTTVTAKTTAPAAAPTNTVAAAAPTAGAAANIQGVTATEIKLGTYHSLSGAVAAVAIEREKVWKAYFSWLNDQGGINGRKVSYQVEDNAADATKAVAAVKKLVEQDKVYALIGGQNSPEGLATRPYLVEKGIAHLSIGCPLSECHAPASGWWGVHLPYDQESKNLVNYAINELKQTKIAIFYANNDYGKDNLKGAKAAIADSGGKAQLVGEAAFNPSDTDMSGLAIKLKSSGAEIIYCAGYAAQTGSLWQEMKKLGYTPQMMGTSTPGIPQIAALMKEDAEGYYTSYIPTPDVDNPSDKFAQNYKAALAKYSPDALLMDSGNYLVWLQVTAAQEVLTRAGNDLSLAGLDKAALTIKDFGPLKVSYTADRHWGIQGYQIGRWNKDKVVLASEYKKP